jgi:O-antigen/teichoic acid export membrane protein
LKKIFLSITKKFNQGSPRTIKLKKNIAGSFLIKAAAVILALIKVPVLLSYLDAEKYGVWLTIASIVLWVNNFDLGLGLGLRNRFAEALAHHDVERGRKLVSTAYVSLAVLMFGLLLLLIPIVYLLNWNEILNVQTIDSKELTYSVLVVLVLFIMRFVFDLISSVLKADQRTALADLYIPLSGLISLILVLIVRIFIKDSLFLACIIIALPPVIVLLIANIYLFRKNYKIYRPSLKYFDRKHLRDIYSLGLKFFFGQMVALVLFSSQNLILAQVVNPTEVTVFNIAKQYFDLPLIFFMIILNPYWSAITDAYAKGDYGWIKSTMKKINLISLVYSVGIIIMLLVSNFAFDLWIGDRASIPFSLSFIFAVYNIFVIMVSPYNYFLNGVGKLNIGMIAGLFKLVAFLPIAILLSQQLGGIGLVAALLIVGAFPNIVLNIMQYNKIVNQKAVGIWNK